MHCRPYQTCIRIPKKSNLFLFKMVCWLFLMFAVSTVFPTTQLGPGKGKNVEKWNMEMVGSQELFLGWMKHGWKLLCSDKSLGILTSPPFLARRCMYSKHMYNTVESRSGLVWVGSEGKQAGLEGRAASAPTVSTPFLWHPHLSWSVKMHSVSEFNSLFFPEVPKDFNSKTLKLKTSKAKILKAKTSKVKTSKLMLWNWILQNRSLLSLLEFG